MLYNERSSEENMISTQNDQGTVTPTPKGLYNKPEMTYNRKMQNDLLQDAVHGDARSITALVQQYTPLVHKIVNKYAWMSPAHAREDLVQEGLLGVVKAIETFDLERGTRFMTWVYPQVRGAVQGMARRELRLPKYPLSLEQSDWGSNLEDPTVFEVHDEFKAEFIHNLIIEGCGSVTSKRAQIVCDRYGLLGRPALRQGEVAKKYNMTKQAINSHIARFSKIIREKHPELESLIK
jgi:RNA polymerase sporulation-specific sigma factor